MPAYKSGDPRILDHYERALRCDRQRAAFLLNQDQVEHFNDRTGSRIQYDQLTDTWRGRKTYLPREKFGLPRKGSNPDSLRNRLVAKIGEKYLTGSEIRSLFENLYGDTKADSKFMQARVKGILKYDETTGRWYLWTTPPPNPKDFGAGSGDSQQAEYVRLYGSMPGLKHKPGERYSAEESQVLKWMGQKCGSTDLKFLEQQYHNVCRFGTSPDNPKAVFIHDKDTRETFGILTYTAEVKAKPEAEPEVTDGDSKKLTDKVLLANLKDDPELLEEYFDEPLTEHKCIEIFMEGFTIDDPDSEGGNSVGVDGETAKRVFGLACRHAILIGFKIPSLGSETIYARKEFWQKDEKQLLAGNKEEKGETLMDIR